MAGRDTFGSFYDPKEEGGSDTGENRSLAAENIGGKLVSDPVQQRDEASGADPVYIFTHTFEPDAEKHFCYTCSTTSLSRRYSLGTDSESTVACTVQITVPRKTPATTTPETTLPPTTSGARAMAASIAAAAGLGLPAMFLM